jgi:galactofuranose transport system permease protein
MFRISIQKLPVLATAIVFVILYTIGAIAYRGFFSPLVFFNFFNDNAYLGITAIGMTFVILAGGIDLSVGAVIGCTSVILATLIEHRHVHPILAIAMVLGMGIVFGTGMGCLIRFFDLPPFLVTLAGLFLCRGIGLLISEESIAFTHPMMHALSHASIHIADAPLKLSGIIFIVMLILSAFVSIYTRFGRNVYAIGGSEQSATLMGLPVGSTKIAIYALSGFFSTFAGVVFTLTIPNGNATAAAGLELDVIAAVVVGGTLLSGGVGSMAGTLLGVLIFGVIQTGIMFQGNLSSWWTRIAVGGLLFVFILMQKVIESVAKMRGKRLSH